MRFPPPDFKGYIHGQTPEPKGDYILNIDKLRDIIDKEVEEKGDKQNGLFN